MGMMGVNGLCLLLTADPVFLRGFGVVLSVAPCLELQQLSLLGERSAASLDWSWEWSGPALSSVPQHFWSLWSCPVPLSVGATSSWEAPPARSRPSQVLLRAVVQLFALPVLFITFNCSFI